MAADDDDDSVLIANTNNVLTLLCLSIKQISSMEELQRVSLNSHSDQFATEIRCSQAS